MKKLMFQEGDKYGNFTFRGYSTDIEDGKVCGYWHCGHCGQVMTRRNSAVKTGKVKSCGCQGTYNLKAKARHNDPMYCWEVLLYRIKLRCERLDKRKRRSTRTISCSITPEYVRQIYHQQQGKCVYTGVELVPPNRHTRLHDSNIVSVDRIDSSLGYVEGNIQLVTKQVNMMKQSMSHAEFVLLCRIITTNHPA